MACECGSGCDDEAASRRLLIIVNITVQIEERDTSIITCFCRHITIRYNQQLSRWASGWMTPDQTSFYAYLIFMHITSSTMIRRQETIHCESETRKFLMHWKGIKWRRWCGKTSNKMESSQRKESGWDSQGRLLFKPKQRRILCSSGINMIIGQNDSFSEGSLTFRWFREMLTDKQCTAPWLELLDGCSAWR